MGELKNKEHEGLLIKLCSHAAVYESLLRGFTVKVASGSPASEWHLVKGQLVNELGDKVSFGFPMADLGFYVAEKVCATDVKERIAEAARAYRDELGSYPSDLYLRFDEWSEAIKVLKKPVLTIDGVDVKLHNGDYW